MEKTTDNGTFNMALEIIADYEKNLELESAANGYSCLVKYFYPVSLLLAYHPVSRIILRTADEFRK